MQKLVGGQYVDLTPEEEAQWATPQAVVPPSVSMRQARLALRRAGLYAAVNAAVAGADEDTQIEWEFATDVWRSRDLVATLGAALTLTSDQIDALFIAAAAIP